MLGSTPLKNKAQILSLHWLSCKSHRGVFYLVFSDKSFFATPDTHIQHYFISFRRNPQNEQSPFVFSVCARRLKAQAELGGALGPLRGALRPLRDLQPLFGQPRPYSCEPRGGVDSASTIPHTQPCTKRV